MSRPPCASWEASRVPGAEARGSCVRGARPSAEVDGRAPFAPPVLRSACGRPFTPARRSILGAPPPRGRRRSRSSQTTPPPTGATKVEMRRNGSASGTARLLLVVQRGLLLARFARDGARRGGDADRLTPVDIVVDPLRRLLAPLSLASLLGLVLGLALELFGPLVRAESRHGHFFTRRFWASPRRIREA